VEATGVSILGGNTEILIAAVHKSPKRLWGDTDITKLLGSRNKFILAEDFDYKATCLQYQSFKSLRLEGLGIICLI
jgi:hypothetical protein